MPMKADDIRMYKAWFGEFLGSNAFELSYRVRQYLNQQAEQDTRQRYSNGLTNPTLTVDFRVPGFPGAHHFKLKHPRSIPLSTTAMMDMEELVRSLKEGDMLAVALFPADSLGGNGGKESSANVVLRVFGKNPKFGT